MHLGFMGNVVLTVSSSFTVQCLPEDVSIYSNKDESMGDQRNAQSE